LYDASSMDLKSLLIILYDYLPVPVMNVFESLVVTFLLTRFAPVQFRFYFQS
jgi:hypothetical protein